MKTIGTIICLLGAVAAVWLAFTTSMELSMAGFPDGHVTDYAAAVDTPLQVVMWAAVGFAILFLGLAFSPGPPRMRVIGIPAAVLVFVAVAVVATMVVPWYYGTHLGLDNGVGG